MNKQALNRAWPRLLDALQEALWLIDARTLKVLRANAASESVTGYEADAALGLPVQVLAATPQQQAFWSDPFNWQAGAQFIAEVRRADGQLAPVEMRVRALDGEVLLVSMLDRREQALHEAEFESLLGELRATLESAADAILVCDPDGRIRAFNHRFATLWGIPEALLVRRNDVAILDHLASQVRDAESYARQLKLLSAQPLMEAADVLDLRDGRILERRAVPQLRRGLPMGRIFSFRDITAEAQTQAGLELAARVFESSLDGIFIADGYMDVARTNPACERLLGGMPVQGRTVESLFEASEGQADTLGDLARIQWHQGGFWEGDLWLRQAGGARCAVRLSWVPLRNAQGDVVQSIGFMRDLTQQRVAQQRIEQLAYSDALTGLPNRLNLTERVDAAIEAARAGGTVFSILFIDLDRFKIINDSLGHQFGDRVLKLVAQRLSDCMRPVDILCRLGGDEFVLYLQGCNAELAASVAKRILQEMERPFLLDGLGFSVQCSIGVAQYPADGLTLDELIRQADTAMYRVKERGRGHFSFYQPQMSAGLLSRMKLEHAMRQALEHGRMAVYFQPQVHIDSDRIVAAEALLRWTDPEFGVVSPGVFIPLAEESGYIVTLGAWVMEQAVQEAARWQQQGMPIKVSVNVSALEFRQSGFVERVTELLRSYGLTPQLLELELTESILLQDAQDMALRVCQIADLGVGMVIDDFGTGYSNLAYLKKLPISKIKIDQSFVRGLPSDEGDQAIVGAIISLGLALGVEIVAEGVETHEQLTAIHRMQGHYFQGFLCAPGLPREQFGECLQAQRAGIGAIAYRQRMAQAASAQLPALKPFQSM
ncbi:bifunctional diguanylate cyclase/phosphodiesterase [Delftia acidovorans]|uniref:bifunctional diguanylate cyclase/phosphodiesterase n=1 Tax=Delftia acidovorans TaxID=80866 RepID=UPI000BD22E03|nr:bifunctional diguanylate cyclase/phosphodiesterase [Delftia acidovorans]ROR02713.1 diguanylate cyclase /diguanylate cyclase/phosphodiesterase [Delftia acidovorans]SOE37044.1 diguanylate cyclase /diguanylate cyclase/phosphodiesterase [Delftia acidovorans]